MSTVLWKLLETNFYEYKNKNKFLYNFNKILDKVKFLQILNDGDTFGLSFQKY